MNRVLRIKGISNAIGIRRSIVVYMEVSEGEFTLDKAEYPLNNLKYSLKIQNNQVKINYKDEEFILTDGESHTFNERRMVKSLTGEIPEFIEVNFLLVPLSSEAIKYYEDSQNKGYVFDEKNGEFSYLIGLIYKSLGKSELSQEYFKKAHDEGFN